MDALLRIKLRSWIGLILLAVFLSACGDGGEGSEGSSSRILTPNGINNAPQNTINVLADEAYAGFRNGIELALSYDPSIMAVRGRVRNETGQPICLPVVRLETFDAQGQATATNIQSAQLNHLDLNCSGQFISTAFAPNTFANFRATVVSQGCNVTVTGGEGREGGGEGSGGEHGPGGEGSGNEGGGVGCGGDGGTEGGNEGTGGGNEAGERNPIQPVGNPLNNLNAGLFADFAGVNNGIFRGTVSNNSTTTMVCGARLEIHTSLSNNGFRELGPTIPMNLAPTLANVNHPDAVANMNDPLLQATPGGNQVGPTLDAGEDATGVRKVVIETSDSNLLNYSLHPEADTCL